MDGYSWAGSDGARSTAHERIGGATEPLANPPIEWSDGTEIRDWCVNAGVRFMARELREHGPLTVFAIGPLTDIACLSVISRARRGGSTAWWRSWAAGGVAG